MPEVKFNNIAVSGEIGTGTTTLSVNLAKHLNWKHINTGEFFRTWHQAQGIAVRDTHQVPAELDRQIDADFQNKMRDETGIIFEARLAGWLGRDLKQTFKVLLTVDPKVAVERVVQREGGSTERVAEEARIRARALRNKFKELYGVENYLDEKYFNMVIDTTNLSRDEVLQTVLKSLR